MKHVVLALGAAAVMTASASGQAITGFSGGSTFDSFYGSLAGDVVGYRFEVTVPISVTHLGVWNDGSFDADHEVGIWDDGMTLLGSATVTPGSAPTGDFLYEPVTSFMLMPGVVYTAGANYRSGDGDSYTSSPTTVDTAPEVTVLNGVFPDAAELGFAFPGSDSTNLARIGPNFLFVPAPASLALLGLGGIVATRRRR